jgi:hypothetical protein
MFLRNVARPPPKFTVLSALTRHWKYLCSGLCGAMLYWRANGNVGSACWSKVPIAATQFDTDCNSLLLWISKCKESGWVGELIIIQLWFALPRTWAAQHNISASQPVDWSWPLTRASRDSVKFCIMICTAHIIRRTRVLHRITYNFKDIICLLGHLIFQQQIVFSHVGVAQRLLGNSPVKTFQDTRQATMEEAVFSMRWRHATIEEKCFLCGLRHATIEGLCFLCVVGAESL